MNKTILLTCVAILVLGFGLSAQTPLNDQSVPASAQSEAMPGNNDTPVEDSKPVPYAWRILPPLGLTERADMDTLPYNYASSQCRLI